VPASPCGGRIERAALIRPRRRRLLPGIGFGRCGPQLAGAQQRGLLNAPIFLYSNAPTFGPYYIYGPVSFDVQRFHYSAKRREWFFLENNAGLHVYGQMPETEMVKKLKKEPTRRPRGPERNPSLCEKLRWSGRGRG
jgi:hypothetical protein